MATFPANVLSKYFVKIDFRDRMQLFRKAFVVFLVCFDYNKNTTPYKAVISFCAVFL